MITGSGKGQKTMAKLKAPLFAFEARGTIAKTLTYFPWKGIDAVRTHVVPANPQTSGQTTQRTRMTDAVDEWHAESYSALDAGAWNRLAGLAAKVMSGFNRMVQNFIDEDILGNTWEPINNLLVSGVGAAGFTVNVTKVSGGNAPTIRYGVSPTALLTTAPLVDQTGNDWEVTLAGLSSDTLYYFTVDVGASATDFGRLGIYTQRTS
jgi:hypothetical protein